MNLLDMFIGFLHMRSIAESIVQLMESNARLEESFQKVIVQTSICTTIAADISSLRMEIQYISDFSNYSFSSWENAYELID